MIVFTICYWIVAGLWCAFLGLAMFLQPTTFMTLVYVYMFGWFVIVSGVFYSQIRRDIQYKNSLDVARRCAETLKAVSEHLQQKTAALSSNTSTESPDVK